MGYSTLYKLHTIPALAYSEINDLLKYFDGEALEPDPFAVLAEPEVLFGDSCKWYEHNDDMKKVSKKHPDVVFILDGEGEESGDVWRKFYKNGKVAVWRPHIEPPEYTPDVFKTLPKE